MVLLLLLLPVLFLLRLHHNALGVAAVWHVKEYLSQLEQGECHLMLLLHYYTNHAVSRGIHSQPAREKEKIHRIKILRYSELFNDQKNPFSTNSTFKMHHHFVWSDEK